METRVVNKRVSEFDVYIGRGSKWGNPFKIGVHGSRDEVIERYQQYLWNRKDLLADLDELRGKRLGCFCAPQACHGDVLVDALAALDDLADAFVYHEAEQAEIEREWLEDVGL